MRIMKSNRKQTFFVIIKLVPIATEPETASNRPMYLSSMMFKFDDGKAKGAAVKPMQGEAGQRIGAQTVIKKRNGRTAVRPTCDVTHSNSIVIVFTGIHYPR